MAGKPPEPVDHLQRAEALRCYGALQAAAVGAVYAGISDRCMPKLFFCFLGMHLLVYLQLCSCCDAVKSQSKPVSHVGPLDGARLRPSCTT